MKTDFVRTLFDYQQFEDRRVWDEAIVPLGEAQFTQDTGYSWGTLERECTHVISVMHDSLHRAQGHAEFTSLVWPDSPSRAAVREQWDQIEAAWHTFLADLDSEGFHQIVNINYRGRPVTIPVWNVICQMINHGTIHRVEMLKMVAELDQPVNFDLSLMQYLTRE